MASSGYTAITFVASEQPTTAKWNLIGSNDASFNTGNGFEDGIIVARHLAAGAVTSPKLAVGTGDLIELGGLKIQSGFAYVTGTGTATVTTTITFSSAYSTPPKVFVSMIGYKTGSNPSGASDITSPASWTVGAYGITGTDFTGYYTQASGTLSATVRIGFFWLAIG